MGEAAIVAVELGIRRTVHAYCFGGGGGLDMNKETKTLYGWSEEHLIVRNRYGRYCQKGRKSWKNSLWAILKPDVAQIDLSSKL